MQSQLKTERTGLPGRWYGPVGWCVAVLAAVPLALLCFMALRHSAAFDHEAFQETMTVVPVDTVQILVTALIL